MKSKKLVSSLMALSIIASSSLMLGTTAKAAPTSGTSKASVTSNSYQLKSIMTSRGDFLWCRIPGAVRYEIYINDIEHHQYIRGFGGGPDFLQAETGQDVTRPARYTATIRAINSSNVVIAEDIVNFDMDYNYDGKKVFTSYGGH